MSSDVSEETLSSSGSVSGSPVSKVEVQESLPVDESIRASLMQRVASEMMPFKVEKVIRKEVAPLKIVEA